MGEEENMAADFLMEFYIIPDPGFTALLARERGLVFALEFACRVKTRMFMFSHAEFTDASVNCTSG